MAKSLKAEVSRTRRLKAGKALQKQREKTLKAETKSIQVKEKARKDILKARKKAGSIFKKVTGAYGYKTKLSQTLMGFSRAHDVPKQATAGRPKKVYVHTSPLSGKPVPAQVYYAHMRQFKNIQARRVEDAKERQIVEYAKRGISPEQIAQIQAQQRQQRLIEQYQRNVQTQSQQIQGHQTQYPNQQRQAEQLHEGAVVDKSTRVWRFRRGVVGTEGGLAGRQKKIYGLPSSFWN